MGDAVVTCDKPNQRAKVDTSQVGKASWAGFTVPLEKIYQAVDNWRQALADVHRPWLCWNVSDRWCKLRPDHWRSFTCDSRDCSKRSS
jgi:hypothetical protein